MTELVLSGYNKTKIRDTIIEMIPVYNNDLNVISYEITKNDELTCEISATSGRLKIKDISPNYILVCKFVDGNLVFYKERIGGCLL